MRKYLVACVSIMLVLGLGATGMAAVSDATGDAFVPGKDILSVDALFYPASSFPVAEYVKLTVTMNTGSSIPGMLTWDFDADNNLATGGSSSLNMPFSPCPKTRCKTEGGFDFYVLLVLRDQADTGNNAYCTGCIGNPGNCVTRGDDAVCDEGTCYQPEDSCTVGDANCYSIETTPCSGGAGCDTAYELEVACGVNGVNCGTGLKYGEWYAGFGTAGNRQPILRGRIENIGSIVDTKTQYCFTLPWGDIVAYASMMGAVDFGSVVDNPPYQLSIWHDPVFADGEDFFDPGLTINVADYVPNTGYAASVASAVEECKANSNPETDCKVDLTDLVKLKGEFGRNNCPNCACTKP